MNEQDEREYYRYLQLKQKSASASSAVASPQPNIPLGQKAYNFAQETVPYVAGGVSGVAGALAGGPLR